MGHPYGVHRDERRAAPGALRCPYRTMWSRRLGDEPASTTTPRVALSTSTCLIVDGVAAGWGSRYSATTPPTNGAASESPSPTTLAESPPLPPTSTRPPTPTS